MIKKVGIILVNYKDYAERFLTPCRDSLRAQDYPAEQTRIYIIDNASTPGSLAYLKNNYPEATVLPRLDGNYAAANNLGFKEAIKDGCEYLVTLNMDTEVEPQWLKELVKALDNNPSAGIVQAKILLYPKDEIEKTRAKINSLGNIIHYLGFGFTSDYGAPDREILAYLEIKGYASGCSFIIRREVFEQVGGYIEEFYMYHDDLELSLKVKLAGYKIILAPRAVVYHKYEFKRSTKMIYYMERNRYLTMLIFYPYRFLAWIFLPLLFLDLGMLFYALFGGWFREEIKIYGHFFRRRTYDMIAKERARLKSFSTVPFEEIARDFEGRIMFQEISNPILKYIANPLMNIYWRLVKLFF
jgi:hypothetical protein